MKPFVVRIAVLLALMPVACTSPPPVHGEFFGRNGTVKVHPDGRFEVIVLPRATK